MRIPRGIDAFRDQRHELLDVSHLVGNGRRREYLISAGQTNIHHRRGVQREYQRRLIHDHHRAARRDPRRATWLLPRGP